MNWDRKCRLCLTDNPVRPVHALKTPELCRLLKDWCSIEIGINDNMDLVCTNCVHVIFSLKFFKSNQKVIEECRGFQKDLMAIKEESYSSDCIIVDITGDVGTNKNGREENIKSVVNRKSVSTGNKTTLTETTSNANDFRSTTKRKLSSDEYSIKEELLDISDDTPTSSILVASDDDTLKNEICFKTQVNTATKICNDYSSKLKKCKILLTRIDTVQGQMSNRLPCPKSKGRIQTNAGPLKIGKRNNRHLRTHVKHSTAYDNLQSKSMQSKPDQIVIKESKDASSSAIAMVISKPKQYTENSIASVTTPSATFLQNKPLTRISNSQTVPNKIVETTDENTTIRCTHINQQKCTATLPEIRFIILNKVDDGMEILKLPSSLKCTLIPNQYNAKHSDQ